MSYRVKGLFAMVIASAVTVQGTALAFGNGCSATSQLDSGLCCCDASRLVAYGEQLPSSASCQDGLACTGADEGFCSGSSHSGAEPYYKQATLSFCQFTCPCCQSLAPRPAGRPERRTTAAVAELGGKTRGAFLGQKWRRERRLFDVTNSLFHRSLVKSAEPTHTLQEVYEAKAEYPSWLQMAKLRESRSWTDQELAMHLYTTEVPLFYGPMNKIMREARHMEDVDTYWQSYVAILRDGLARHAAYVNVSTYRGVDCDAAGALQVGEEGVLASFTSTSAELSVAKAFGCTVLHFSGGGYDMRKYSHFPGEAEVLMEGGRVYTVTRNEPGDAEKKEVHLETEPAGGSAPASRQAPRRSCEGFDLSQCDVCRCCDRPPSELPWKPPQDAREGGWLWLALLVSGLVLLTCVVVVLVILRRRESVRDFRLFEEGCQMPVSKVGIASI
mmetsp:Transcript_93638/g.248583  ORF Transcript_93638/g.248583 Transcript_93638/m.248583 type:complete len:443 (-) Transcript_93638:283-1611(-)